MYLTDEEKKELKRAYLLFISVVGSILIASGIIYLIF